MFYAVCLLAVFHMSEGDLNIRSFHIHSQIKYRFARTVISSTVENTADKAEEIKFDVAIPNNAFISNMTIEMDGSVYSGTVKEKSTATKEYVGAQSEGLTAGFISTKPRRANVFQLKVNVEAKKIATFNLTYEELLRRYTGKYEHTIYLSPGKPVDDFKVDVSILESRDIKRLKVPAIRQDLIQTKDGQPDSLTDAVIKQPIATEATIVYSPTVDSQTVMSSSGISGQLVVEYDVDRDKDAGDILASSVHGNKLTLVTLQDPIFRLDLRASPVVSGGYFVHYFGASGIKPLPKQILFVLDKSGSMVKDKIDHLKKALFNILKDIKEDDEFNFISFEKTVTIWSKDKMVLGTQANKDRSINYLNKDLIARGGTDINLGLTKGLELLRKLLNPYKAQVLIFLTDGDSNSGLQGTDRITNNIWKLNIDRVPMFGLAFGEKANLELVNKLAIQNSGFSRKIFTDSDADLQIEGFYDEISTVIMTNVTFEYLNSEVDMQSVTDAYINTLFDGSEHIVSGETTASGVTNIQSLVQGNGADGMLVLRNPLSLTKSSIPDFDLGRFTERLYAFLVIKKLIQKIETSEFMDTESQTTLLSLSLKYSFVTPATAMVVVLPRISETVSLMDAGTIVNEDTAARPTISNIGSNMGTNNNPGAPPIIPKPLDRPPGVINRSGVSGISVFDRKSLLPGKKANNATFSGNRMESLENNTSDSNRMCNPVFTLQFQFLLALVYNIKHIVI